VVLLIADQAGPADTPMTAHLNDQRAKPASVQSVARKRLWMRLKSARP